MAENLEVMWSVIFLILIAPIICFLVIVVVGITVTGLFEEWDILGPMLAIMVISAILGAVINAAINNKELRNNGLTLHSDPLLQTEKEKQFRKKSDRRFGLFYGGIMFVLLLFWLLYILVFR